MIQRRELPCWLRSSPSGLKTLVASTTLSRSPLRALATITADSPAEYLSAVSTKLIPASRALPMVRIESSLDRDAQRNIDAHLSAAKEELAWHGVDVRVRAITARAGVGTATLYRHYPPRADLISAVFRCEIDGCAAAAPPLAANASDEAFNLWLHRYTEFVATGQRTGSLSVVTRWLTWEGTVWLGC